MPYILSILRGDDPDAAPAELAQDRLSEILNAHASVTVAKPHRWRFDDGVVGIDLSVDDRDPTSELQLKVGWSTSDQLLHILDFAADLATKLDARVYDRNGHSWVTNEKIDAIRASGGASPARR